MKTKGVLEQVRLLLISGYKYTIADLNAKVGTQDSVKCISRLRQKGYNIKDKYYTDGRKRYWIDNQLTFDF